jgi:hypothetical protein
MGVGDFGLKAPRIPQQYFSLSIMFTIIIAVFIIGRMVFIPKSFGQYGHYRADAVNDVESLPIKYAGYHVCQDCHDDIYELKAASNHKGLACETCHGAAAKHVEDPDNNKPAIPKVRDFCPLCHGYNPARPTGFPQITEATHNPGKACTVCHNPHSPVTPNTPADCSACHREISNEKAVSPHVSLACTRCHKVPEIHLTSPRQALPQKPTTRDFCGECHASATGSGEGIPQIELANHGGRYLCWDCHYPHHPEVK